MRLSRTVATKQKYIKMYPETDEVCAACKNGAKAWAVTERLGRNFRLIAAGLGGHDVIKIDYQSKDQLISQSINKPNKHAWKRTTNHSINRSIRPSINQSSKKPINRPTNQSINPSINRRSNNRETAIKCNSASARAPERK